MKRVFVGIAAAALIGAVATGCGSSAESGAGASAAGSASAASSAGTAMSSAPTGAATLTSQDGKLVDKDLTAEVIEGSGFEITIDPAAQTALFQTVDPSTGDPFKNSDLFDYANGTFVRTVFVSAMGTTYLYTADLASGELQMIQNAAGEDVSESVRGQGRWDSVASATATQQTDIESYFQTRYGTTIQDAVTA